MSTDYDRPKYGSVPPKGTKVYRGERGTEGNPTVGIHWTTDQNVAKPFTTLDKSGELLSVELTDPEKQVIPYGHLKSAYYDKSTGRVRSSTGSTMQGLPFEQEIRLRPGVSFDANGRKVTVDNTRGDIIYPNIHKYAVTPESSDKEWGHAVTELGHIQSSMFDEVPDEYFKPAKYRQPSEAVRTSPQFQQIVGQLQLPL